MLHAMFDSCVYVIGVHAMSYLSGDSSLASLHLKLT